MIVLTLCLLVIYERLYLVSEILLVCPLFLSVITIILFLLVVYNPDVSRAGNIGGWAQNRHCKKVGRFKFAVSVPDHHMYNIIMQVRKFGSCKGRLKLPNLIPHQISAYTNIVLKRQLLKHTTGVHNMHRITLDHNSNQQCKSET